MNVRRIEVQRMLPEEVREQVQSRVARRIASELRLGACDAAIRLVGTRAMVIAAAAAWHGGASWWLAAVGAWSGAWLVLAVAALWELRAERRFRMQAWSIERSEWSTALRRHGIGEAYPR